MRSYITKESGNSRGNTSRVFLIMMLSWILSMAGHTSCFATTVNIQWDAVTDPGLAGYKIYYQADSSAQPFSGTGATQGAAPVNVLNQTSTTISGLDPSHSYYFAITAYDTSGVESSYSNYVYVPELVSPTTSINSPANNTAVSGTVSVTATGSDNVGVTKVEFYVNGALAATDTVTPYVYSWNTTSLVTGSYVLMTKAYDAAGNIGQSSNVTVTVVNDSVAPIVSLTSPVNGSIVNGTVPIAASASDNVGVGNVEFYLNGALLFASNVSPYIYNWNTTSVSNGNYTLTAKAYDNAGNFAQSANVSVSVNNSVVPPAPTTYMAVFGNVAGANYPNTIEDTFLNINTDVNSASTILNTYTWPANTPANAILMKWNVSALPANAQIQSATLYLSLVGSGGDAMYEVPISQIINKQSVIASSNGSTYDGINAWTPSSIPYGGFPLAQSDIGPVADAPLIDGTNGYKSWNVTSIVNDWFTTPGNNKGLLLNSSNKASSDSYRIFASSEAVDTTQRPKLVVTYTLASDTIAPTINIGIRKASSGGSGILAVTATANDNVGVSKVEFYVNGVLASTATSAPYVYNWDSTAVSSGSYTLIAKAYDAAGNIGQSGTVRLSKPNVQFR